MKKMNLTPTMTEANNELTKALKALSQAREDRKNTSTIDEYDEAGEAIRHSAWQVAFVAQELTKIALTQVWVEGGMTEEALKDYQHRLNEAIFHA